MVDEKAINAMQPGDTIVVNFGKLGNWLPVKLLERREPDGKTHLQILIEYYGYDNLRIP